MAIFLRLKINGFKKMQKVVAKNLFLKKSWRLWESLYFQSNSGAYLLLLAVSKRDFFGKTYLLFFKKSNFWSLWGSLLFQSPSAANLLPLAILKEAKFSRKTRIFWKKTQLLHALSNFTMPVGFHGNFSSFHF